MSLDEEVLDEVVVDCAVLAAVLVDVDDDVEDELVLVYFWTFQITISNTLDEELLQFQTTSYLFCYKYQAAIAELTNITYKTTWLLPAGLN